MSSLEETLAKKIINAIESKKIPGYIRDEWLMKMEYIDDHLSDEECDRLVKERKINAVKYIAKLISNVY